MKQNKTLPDWCRILDGLIAEIAKERGENPKELKDRLVLKIEEEKRAGVGSSQPEQSSIDGATNIPKVPSL